MDKNLPVCCHRSQAQKFYSVSRVQHSPMHLGGALYRRGLFHHSIYFHLDKNEGMLPGLVGIVHPLWHSSGIFPFQPSFLHNVFPIPLELAQQSFFAKLILSSGERA